MSSAPLTPMMAQYQRIKSELPRDTLLLFRLGDFYEMFFEDAEVGARVLNLTLTRRNEVPMCGLPYHAASGYLTRLLRAGRKVAICDQTEEARPGKLVERAVTAILSPGTHFDERLLAADRNNFLAALHRVGPVTALACVDLTTGDFRVTELADESRLATELDRLRPAEVIHPPGAEDLAGAAGAAGAQAGEHEAWTFQLEAATDTLCRHFGVAALDGFGLRGRPAAIGAAGAVIHYLVHNLRRDVAHLTRLGFYEVADHLVLDAISLRNLELLEPLRPDAARNTTLFAAVNRTATPMGARRLRDWLTQPLAAHGPLVRRQDAVEAWRGNPAALEAFRTRLLEVRDLERTLSRLSLGSGNGRDLLALRLALEQIPHLKGVLVQLGPAPATDLIDAPDAAEAATGEIARLGAALADLPALVELLARSIVDEPPLAVREGGVIRDGFSPELDELRDAARNGREWIARLQREEVERTGIPSLKVGFNSVFGYYLEVTRANLAKVPPEYIRKQTVANGERYITPELKAMEQKILGAEERATRLEYELFLQVREEVLAHLRPIQETAAALAQLDVLAAFAQLARERDWVRPVVGDEGRLELVEGRHPVLDQSVGGERFVPNDTRMNPASDQILLLTGPNMAGKSTYIRQVALLVLLAHTGSCVPAREARVDLVDRIFTRIGASDDLARGQSTFMVEMSETANILNNATRRSLVILDEVGRGTSTFDGLSLAWSIVEHLHHQVGAKTLFATHYHELTELGSHPDAGGSADGIRLPRVRNYHVAVREWNDQLIFLRQVLPGATDKSHGIQVARLAGVPRPVLDRARAILRVLEEAELNLQGIQSAHDPGGSTPTRRRRPADRDRLRSLAPSGQLDLFA